jgi:hypothetical protein
MFSRCLFFSLLHIKILFFLFSFSVDAQSARSNADELVIDGSPVLSRDAQVLARAHSVLNALPYPTTGIALDAVAVWTVPLKSSQERTVKTGDIVLFDAMSSEGGSVLNSRFHHAYDSLFRCQVRFQ